MIHPDRNHVSPASMLTDIMRELDGSPSFVDARLAVMCRGLAEEMRASSDAPPALWSMALETLRTRLNVVRSETELFEHADLAVAPVATGILLMAEMTRRRVMPSDLFAFRPGSMQMKKRDELPAPLEAMLKRLRAKAFRDIHENKEISWQTIALLNVVLATGASRTELFFALEIARRACLLHAQCGWDLYAGALLITGLELHARAVADLPKECGELVLQLADPDGFEARVANRLVGELAIEDLDGYAEHVARTLLVREQDWNRFLRSLGDAMNQPFTREKAAQTAQAVARKLLGTLQNEQAASICQILREYDKLDGETEKMRRDSSSLEDKLAKIMSEARDLVRNAKEVQRRASEANKRVLEAPSGSWTTEFFGSHEPTLIARGPWVLASAQAADGQTLMEYCLPGESLEEWTSLLSISSLPRQSQGALAERLGRFASEWQGRLLDGSLERLEQANVPSLVRGHAASASQRMGIVIRSDSVLGDLSEICELWIERDRLFMLRLSLREAPIDERLRAHLAEGVVMSPAKLSLRRLERSDTTEIQGQLAQLTLAIKRCAASSQYFEFVYARALLALRDIVATPFTSTVHEAISRGFGQVSDSGIFGRPNCYTLRRRLEWLDPGSEAFLLNLEEIALARFAEGSTRAFVVLTKVARARVARGNHGGALRALTLLQSCPRGTQGLDAMQSLIDVTSDAIRGGCDPADVARLSIAAARALRATEWDATSDVVIGIAMLLYENGVAAAAAALDPDLREQAATEFSASVALGIESERGAIDVASLSLHNSEPLGEVLYMPRVDAIYLRNLAEQATVERGMFSAEVLAKHSHVFERVKDRLPIEHALSVAMHPFPMVAVGGPTDGFGAGHIVTPQDGEHWQEAVRAALGSNAESPSRKLIFMIPSTSQGVLWEIQLLSQLAILHDVYFVMPAESMDPGARDKWTAGVLTWQALTGCTFPAYQTCGGAVRFREPAGVPEMTSLEHILSGGLINDIVRELSSTAEFEYEFYFSRSKLSALSARGRPSRELSRDLIRRPSADPSL